MLDIIDTILDAIDGIAGSMLDIACHLPLLALRQGSPCACKRAARRSGLCAVSGFNCDLSKARNHDAVLALWSWKMAAVLRVPTPSATNVGETQAR